ncbi:MAG: hypothetical protein EHM64_13490 [Ignavibacteriae bacterium]|nr:MAG: hypothetical protein EHM64_13490 [Ignavibacteriota bacterium]
MKPANRIFLYLLIPFAAFQLAGAQTKCVWVVKTQDGEQVQKIGISYPLVQLLGNAEGDFDINGVKLKYKTLLKAYNSGSVMRIKDAAGETKIFGGKFDQKMNEHSSKHNRLIIENTDKGGEPDISKIRVKSIQAMGMLLTMFGSKDFDEDMDQIESVLEQGGVLYVRDEKENSTLWMYVN